MGSIFCNNSNGIYLTNSENNIILNSIFFDNNNSDISGNDNVVATINNNYIDITNFKSNNIFSNINLGFVDINNSDYNLTSSSGLIDAGTTDIEGVTFPTADLAGNKRISGSSIDIGPYEFSTTRPTCI
jgi:hypothetical protein